MSLVTISIPTYNSAKTLKLCLRAIKKQTYKEIEVNIIDNDSRDNTSEIANKYGAQVKTVKGSLLKARYEGAKLAKGKYCVILDSDQILERDAIKRAVDKCVSEDLDMLVFEEEVYKSDKLLEKLFQLDRKLINRVNDLSPYTGVIMPRFFKTKLLVKAYSNIPKKYFPTTGGPDHAIVYYESWKLSKKIGVVEKSVRHMEPNSFRVLFPKFFRWGYTSLSAHYGKYNSLMSKKERFRTGLFTKGLYVESVGSIALLLFKGIGFKSGYYVAMLDRKLGRMSRY